MTKAARKLKLIILLVVLLGVAGVFAYRVIADTGTASSTCPSGTKGYNVCPRKGTLNKEGHEGHFNKEGHEGHFNKEGYEGHSNKEGYEGHFNKEGHEGHFNKEGNKACPYKGNSEKKAAWVHPKK